MMREMCVCCRCVWKECSFMMCVYCRCVQKEYSFMMCVCRLKGMFLYDQRDMRLLQTCLEGMFLHNEREGILTGIQEEDALVWCCTTNPSSSNLTCGVQLGMASGCVQHRSIRTIFDESCTSSVCWMLDHSMESVLVQEMQDQFLLRILQGVCRIGGGISGVISIDKDPVATPLVREELKGL